MELNLGKHGDKPLALKLKTLRRHMVCLGSSGSGKTVACKVICEEFIRHGIPVIAFDPQGDIASLAHSISPETARKHGLSPSMVKEYRDKAEVVVWTPASSLGAPISVNPIGLVHQQAQSDLDYEENLRSISLAAESLTNLLDCDLSSDEGKLTAGILNLVLAYIQENDLDIDDFTSLADFLDKVPKPLLERIEPIASKREVKSLAKKIRLLTVGHKKLLFELGKPLDIETLLGLGDKGTPGKTRLSVIYLNTLTSQEEKAFFVARVATALYQWMLSNPSEGVQALFYIDEVAPFLPPIRKPASKDILKLLFKQARKYGVACLIASQNPGDVDYNSLSQCSTWNLGRLLTRQDIKKVEKMLKSVSPEKSDEIVAKLPSLDPGQFLLFCPDEFDDIIDLQVRWLLTEHRTLSDDAIREIVSEPLRKRYLQESPPSALKVEKEVEAEEKEDGNDDGSDEVLVIVDEEELATPHRLIDFLEQEPACFTVQELADRLQLSNSHVNKSLKELGKDVNRAKVSRSYVYWHPKFAFLPEYGLTYQTEVAKLQVLEQEAVRQAERQLDRALIVFETEKIEEVSLKYIPLWQVHFTESLEKSFLFIFKKTQHKSENIYFHGTNKKICIYEHGEGFHFVNTPKANPSLIVDLDDICVFENAFPGDLDISKRTWKKIISETELDKLVSQKFKIDVHQNAMTFLPVWRFDLVAKKGKKKKRKLYLDGVTGMPVSGL